VADPNASSTSSHHPTTASSDVGPACSDCSGRTSGDPPAHPVTLRGASSLMDWVGYTGKSKTSTSQIEFEALSSHRNTVQQTTIQHTQTSFPLCNAFHSPFFTPPPNALPTQSTNSHLLQHLSVANSNATSSCGCKWPGVFASISPISHSPSGPSDAAHGLEHFLNPHGDIIHQSRPTLACATPARVTRHPQAFFCTSHPKLFTPQFTPSSIIRAWSLPSTAPPWPPVRFLCQPSASTASFWLAHRGGCSLTTLTCQSSASFVIDPPIIFTN